MTDATGPFRSGELARVAGVSSDTLRFYENQGLLARPPRTLAGYRVYPAEAIQRVRLIRGALSLGFTIAEMKQLLRQRDTGGAPCLLARRIAQTKLDLLEQELEEMQEYRKILRKALRAWDSRIACSPANARLRLLETFIEANPESTKRSSPLLPRGLRKLQARKSR